MDTYGFCAVRLYNSISKGRLIIPNDEYDIEDYVELGIGIYVGVDSGVSLSELLNGYKYKPELKQSTDSFQVRIKAIYKNSKGLYHTKNPIQYLSESDVQIMNNTFKEIIVSK